jgi:hypothetical protein
MIENEHYHYIQDREGRFICIDVAKVSGKVFSVSYYFNTPPMEARTFDLSHLLGSSLSIELTECYAID